MASWIEIAFNGTGYDTVRNIETDISEGSAGGGGLIQKFWPVGGSSHNGLLYPTCNLISGTNYTLNYESLPTGSLCYKTQTVVTYDTWYQLDRYFTTSSLNRAKTFASSWTFRFTGAWYHEFIPLCHPHVKFRVYKFAGGVETLLFTSNDFDCYNEWGDGSDPYYGYADVSRTSTPSGTITTSDELRIYIDTGIFVYLVP